MTFVDASALVAMMTDESDAAELAARLERARNPITSPIALFETAAAVETAAAGGVRALGRPVLLLSIGTGVLAAALVGVVAWTFKPAPPMPRPISRFSYDLPQTHRFRMVGPQDRARALARPGQFRRRRTAAASLATCMTGSDQCGGLEIRFILAAAPSSGFPNQPTLES